MAWYNVLSVSGWLKAGLPTPVTTTDRLPVETGLTQPTTPEDVQPVADDYQTGEILPDQTGSGAALVFTFSAPVQNIWVNAVNPLDLTDVGEVRVDPFGGTPSATLGIPVGFGSLTPIPATLTTVRVFAGVGVRVTVYGNRR
jgi:murein DD-endopeptidase MepM/ murein hydrolase activator NlpD